MSNLLYYPYIDLPKTDWSLRTLMYYDTIGSIVPNSYFHYPEENYEPFMLELVRSDLVVPIDPIAAIDRPNEISRPFIRLIESNLGKLRVQQKGFAQSNAVYARIHGDKFDNEIFYHLQEMGLAERKDNNWYSVEKKTANNLMYYLATIVSAKTNRLPVTDQMSTFRFKKTLKLEQKKRETILTELIPYPEEMNLLHLQRFKERHSELAVQFRNRVEQIVHDPSIKEGTSLFHYKMAEMIDCKDELVARMEETHGIGKLFFGTVCGLISGVSNLIDPNPLNLIGTLAGFGNAVNSALQIERAENVFDQSGMKYLALANYKLKK
ncbi:kinase [Sphingobacterium sp.]|uniref:kinase n=1 Tax=Sphingobacterium sp. TaxID=341027 RepID=UPI0028A977E8|nr:kinase [Sphingobacterium sp.]